MNVTKIFETAIFFIFHPCNAVLYHKKKRIEYFLLLCNKIRRLLFKSFLKWTTFSEAFPKNLFVHVHFTLTLFWTCTIIVVFIYCTYLKFPLGVAVGIHFGKFCITNGRRRMKEMFKTEGINYNFASTYQCTGTTSKLL